MLCALNNKMHIGGIFCDLTEAFDFLNRDVSVSQLNFYGIQCQTRQWFKSYLTDSKQKVEIKFKS
jgi:hypothetical protein